MPRPKLTGITVIPWMPMTACDTTTAVCRSEGKTETYSVEAGNAELRQHLARLTRASRCFSRCPFAFECAPRVFVDCFNRRQLFKPRFPAYPVQLIDFVGPLC